MRVSDLHTPALLVDESRLENNIRRMAAKAKSNGVHLRPHIKTHKCIEIGRMQSGEGARGITTSTIAETAVFAEAGFDDITLAIPLTRDKMDSAIELASRVSLKVLVDHPETVAELSGKCRSGNVEIDVLLKVDCGYHRCGVDPDSASAVSLAKKISQSRGLHFAGILTHAGHAYAAGNAREVNQIADQEQNVMIDFSRKLSAESRSVRPETVSIGSTPTVCQCSAIRDGITEVRPGNYVFFDYTQMVLGSCAPTDCALTVLASVVGTYPNHLVVDAGATAMSKDAGPTHMEPNCGFGVVLDDYETASTHAGAVLSTLSQEHGKITLGQGMVPKELVPSSAIRIVPNHACLTAALFDRYYVVDKETIKETWQVRRDRFAR